MQIIEIIINSPTVPYTNVNSTNN